MISAIAGQPEPIVASQPVQADVSANPAGRNQVASATVAASQPAEVKAIAPETKSAATMAKEAAKAAVSSPLDINLRFRIDQKTQDVTVFLLNQHTREVIRTIPPSELAKLKPGDLVNLFA